MKEKIQAYLREIESQRNIRILLACETGSRAWGFPSPDSDFDIRLIYAHKKDWYLSLNEGKDTIELMLEDNNLDISGWDLRKSLRLLSKSNPPLLERIQSPILYLVDKPFLTELTELANTHYSRIATLHHYLSMAKKCYAAIQENPSFKLKKFFYALRSATACKWIMERSEMPPIQFQVMLNSLTIETELTTRIQELIDLKSTVDEAYLHQGEAPLFHFISDCIEMANAQAKMLPAAKGQKEELALFFRKTLG